MTQLILLAAVLASAALSAVWLNLRRRPDPSTWVCRTCLVDFASEPEGILHCQLMHPEEFAEQQRWSSGLP